MPHVAALAGLAAVPMLLLAAALYSDNFEGYGADTNWAEGTDHGPWHVRFTGFGAVGVEADGGSHVLFLRPQAATRPAETSSTTAASISIRRTTPSGRRSATG